MKCNAVQGLVIMIGPMFLDRRREFYFRFRFGHYQAYQDTLLQDAFQEKDTQQVVVMPRAPKPKQALWKAPETVLAVEAGDGRKQEPLISKLNNDGPTSC